MTHDHWHFPEIKGEVFRTRLCLVDAGHERSAIAAPALAALEVKRAREYRNTFKLHSLSILRRPCAAQEISILSKLLEHVGTIAGVTLLTAIQLQAGNLKSPRAATKQT